MWVQVVLPAFVLIWSSLLDGYRPPPIGLYWVMSH